MNWNRFKLSAQKSGPDIQTVCRQKSSTNRNKKNNYSLWCQINFLPLYRVPILNSHQFISIATLRQCFLFLFFLSVDFIPETFRVSASPLPRADLREPWRSLAVLFTVRTANWQCVWERNAAPSNRMRTPAQLAGMHNEYYNLTMLLAAHMLIEVSVWHRRRSCRSVSLFPIESNVSSQYCFPSALPISMDIIHV